MNEEQRKMRFRDRVNALSEIGVSRLPGGFAMCSPGGEPRYLDITYSFIMTAGMWEYLTKVCDQLDWRYFAYLLGAERDTAQRIEYEQRVAFEKISQK